MKRKAFTLIEMLTVIAITAILFGIIVVPVVQSINLLNLASSYNQAQENSRVLLTNITREIGNSAGVRDNSGDNGAMAVTVPSGPGSTDPTVTILLPYSKLDIVNFAEGTPGTNGANFNAGIGKDDPTLLAPKGQVVLPLAPGSTITRYFIALREPIVPPTGTPAGTAVPYNDPYSGILMAKNGNQDNLYVLYKATVNPFVWDKKLGYIPNAKYFQTDANGNIILDDPYFMTPDGTAAKNAIINNWLAVAQIQTQLSRFDMIQPDYNKSNGQAIYTLNTTTGDYVPRLVSLLQFRPALESTQSATAETPYRLGNEGDNSASYGPDVFRTQFGGWTQPTIAIDQNGGSSETISDQTRSDGSTGFSLYDGTSEMFDVSDYLASEGGVQKYPFSVALQATLNRYNWISANPALINAFEPMSFDSVAGKIYASFPISDVGLNALPDTAADPSGLRPNLPLVGEGTQLNYQADPEATAVFGGPGYAINDAFNRSMAQFPDQTGNIKRIIDLRVTPNEDGLYGPLFPTQTANFTGGNVVVSGNQSGFGRATIVPGSDVVYGPDQNPGPNYGNEVRYTRISAGDPRPNQYRINYAGQQVPANFLSNLSVAEASGFNAGVYDPTNFASAMLAAQYAPGVIILDSDPNQPIPNTVPFKVSYRFEFTSQTDSVAVSYGTRQVMNLLVTIRTYPQSNSTPNPQAVTLKSTAAVRNFLRS